MYHQSLKGVFVKSLHLSSGRSHPEITEKLQLLRRRRLAEGQRRLNHSVRHRGLISQNTSRTMERRTTGGGGRRIEKESKAAPFFVATLVMWCVSVFFEILFNCRYELSPILVGIFFFQSANYAFRNFLSRDPVFVNTCVSLLHSSITSAFVVLILFNQWTKSGVNEMFGHSELVEVTWPWAFQTLCFSCGYFAYDQLDMLLYRLYSGWIPSILVHHLLLLVCFTLALYRKVTINYLILTLICELHSIFLHIRKIRRVAGVRDLRSNFVKVEWLLNLLTFVFARFASHILIIVKLIRDAPKFDKGVELPLALFGMVGMNSLNLFLGMDLFHAYRRERKSKDDNQNSRD